MGNGGPTVSYCFLLFPSRFLAAALAALALLLPACENPNWGTGEPVSIGMSKAEVEHRWGRPMRRVAHVSAHETWEAWQYSFYTFYFDGNQLVSWTEH